MQITHSKDGVAIPDEGLTFEFTIAEGTPEERVESITLHDVLAGLNVEIREGKQQSQAQSFASFALQKGFTTEAEILEKFRKARPFMDGGQVKCNSWGLISDWQAEIQHARQQKSRETMRAEGTEISPGQMSYAMDLIPRLREKGFTGAADDLFDLVQINEERHGPQGAAMSASISKARDLLDMSEPRSQRGQRNSQGNGTTTEQRVSDQPVDPPEEPF